MKKVTFLLLLAVCIFLPFNLFSQNLDEVLNNHFKAINQKEFSTVTTLIAKGKAIQMGMELPFTQIQKRPAKSYLEVEIQNMKLIQAYDGESGWTIEPWTGSIEPRDMSGPELKNIKQQADMDGDLFDWKKKGYQLELIGKEDLEGSDVFNLKLTKNDGDIFNYFIDAEAFVILKVNAKIKFENNTIESETILSNYKPVRSVLVAHATEIKVDGQTIMQLRIDNIEINPVVDDSKFKKPVKQ